MSSFGDLIKRLRKERSLTLDQVARRVGSHKGYVSGIENGKVKGVDFATLERLAQALEIDPALLVGKRGK